MNVDEIAMEMQRIVKHAARGNVTFTEALDRVDRFLFEQGMGGVADGETVYTALRETYMRATGAVIAD
jgi:hexokinase